ncbi:hypothetical protein ST47_g9417 [Ascochyta rabiei]|uniref:Heterokaryon incompatibility domain-containing protein n=1 Tax=Didymella rabiei TaxID=5454 RepID=A0A162XAA0_DIDRA|nr:hypothetical protein ST47_g9417 [Ascochyta rabiei]
MDQRQEVVKSGGGIEDITHHFWKSNLRRAAEKGCRICAAVWQHWVRTPISAPALLGFWQPVTSYTWSRDGQRLEISSKPAGWFLTTSDKFVFRVFDIQENELQWRSINRTIDLCTWSPRIIERAKLWLLDCISNHERCTSSLQDKIYLPTRLVRIAQEARKLKLSLYQTGANTEKIRYATLSHCWGNIKGGQLIAENYDDYVSDIPTQSLPLNFRHAVRIAADLGLEFIWIDSLCIVQGSKKDWDHEAPTMRSIYANSVCNIAATDASDSTQGLIFKRDPIAILPSAFGKDRSAFLSNETDLFDHPLYRRAWVMQELLLAPRTLHFSRAQVHWSCNTAKASEVYPSINFDWTAGQIDHHPARNFSVLHGSSQSTILNARMLETQFKAMLGYDQTEIAQFPSNNAESRSVLYPRADSSVARVSHYGKVRSFGRHPFNQWAALVESYTKMNITMSSDRPIALHGVVTLLTPYLGQFIGGVWRTFLPMELLWETRITSWRPRTYQAPSWSWLSVEGPITYSRCFRHHPGQTFIATITDMHIEYDENNMIVATPPAWLRIRGKLAKAYWEGQGFRYIHKAKGVPVIREVCPAQATQEPEGEEASFFFDDARYAPRLFFDEYQDRYHLDEDIYLLAIRHAFPEGDVDKVGSVDGLVLRRSEGLSHFTRVGIFSDAHCLQLLPFFDCLSESEIVIV